MGAAGASPGSGGLASKDAGGAGLPAGPAASAAAQTRSTQKAGQDGWRPCVTARIEPPRWPIWRLVRDDGTLHPKWPLDALYREAIALADIKKELTDADLIALVDKRAATGSAATIELLDLWSKNVGRRAS